MNPIDDGGPAFPHGPLGDSMHGEDGLVWHQYPAMAGMSLRDWFASQALITCTAHAQTIEDAAIGAYRFADAMIAARKGGAR